jgi:hypothetical protein
VPTPVPACLRVTALGVPITLKVHGDEVAAAVRTAWTDALTDSGDPADDGADARTVLHVAVGTRPEGVEADRWIVGRDLAATLHALSPALTQRAIEARAGDLVMLHAAALADPTTGATAVLVAPSGTGKTTASATLGRRLAYLTDETAGIDADGRMVAYRKPLSILRDGPVKAQVSPSELGLLLTERPCHLATILLIQRDPEHAGTPLVEEVGTVDALAALVPQASYLSRFAQPLQRLGRLCQRVGGVRRVTYAECADLAGTVESLLAREVA